MFVACHDALPQQPIQQGSLRFQILAGGKLGPSELHKSIVCRVQQGECLIQGGRSRQEKKGRDKRLLEYFAQSCLQKDAARALLKEFVKRANTLGPEYGLGILQQGDQDRDK
jgi:hypothetical protein